jgi:hypothetical protein
MRREHCGHALLLFVLCAARKAPDQTDDGSPKARAGICVTGQLTRLELKSKMDHLIKPNLRDYDIDLLIVVDPEGARHVNVRDAKGEGAKIGNSPITAGEIKRMARTVSVKLQVQ